jgi:hypothetical protein
LRRELYDKADSHGDADTTTKKQEREAIRAAIARQNREKSEGELLGEMVQMVKAKHLFDYRKLQKDNYFASRTYDGSRSASEYDLKHLQHPDLSTSFPRETFQYEEDIGGVGGPRAPSMVFEEEISSRAKEEDTSTLVGDGGSYFVPRRLKLQKVYNFLKNKHTRRRIPCNDLTFGDPMRGINPESMKKTCWIVQNQCEDFRTADFTSAWYDVEDTERQYGCDWYAENPEECRAGEGMESVIPPAVDQYGRSNLEACCACGGGTKKPSLITCAEEGDYCNIDLEQMDNWAIYYGILWTKKIALTQNPTNPPEASMECL